MRLGRHLVAGADVLDRVLGSVTLGKPDVRNPASVGMPDLLAELGSRRRNLGADAARAQHIGDRLGRRPLTLVTDGDQDARWHRAGGADHAGGEQRHEQPRDPEGDPDAREGDSTITGKRVIAAAGTDRPQRLVTDQLESRKPSPCSSRARGRSSGRRRLHRGAERWLRSQPPLAHRALRPGAGVRRPGREPGHRPCRRSR